MMKRWIAILTLLITAQCHAMFWNLYDYEAQRWGTELFTKGGTLSGSSYIAGTRFMLEVKSWGVRPLLGRVSLYLGSNTNAIQSPIINDWSGGAPAQTNDVLKAFAAADYSETNGLTGNTTTKYIQPDTSGSSFGPHLFTAITNVHIAAYIRTPTNEQSFVMGQVYPASAYCLLKISYANVTEFSIGLNVPTVADTNGTGFYCATRTAANNGVMYKNGTAIITDSNTDIGVFTSGEAFVHCINSGGAVGNTTRTLSYYAWGFKVSPALIGPYTTAVRNVQLALGRAVQ